MKDSGHQIITQSIKPIRQSILYLQDHQINIITVFIKGFSVQCQTMLIIYRWSLRSEKADHSIEKIRLKSRSAWRLERIDTADRNKRGTTFKPLTKNALQGV